MLQTGNTFDQTTFTVGHARKVWREIRGQWPAGGQVSNISDWKDAGKIPAGTPAYWSVDANGNKTVKCLTKAQVTALGGESNTDSVNGHTQEDILIKDTNTKATATVINDGDIYEYMLDSAVVAKLKTLNVNGYNVVFVQ